jgi:hypothetical protein
MKKIPLKMGERSRNVIENKCRKNGAFRLSTMLMKINELNHSLQDVDEKKGS